MRQAITTKYLGPTNSRGSRIKATARKRDSHGPELSHTEPYQYRGTEQEHCAAAKACAEKLGWLGLWIGGGNVDGDGYVFVALKDVPHLRGSECATALGVEGRDWFLAEQREA